MIRKATDAQVDVHENMRGGMGSAEVTHFAEKSEMLDKNRLFARIVLKTGCSIGYHVHENDMEVYHIVSGVGTYDDNGKAAELFPGDTSITPEGHGHGIVNNGDEDLVIIALIVLK